MSDDDAGVAGPEVGEPDAEGFRQVRFRHGGFNTWLGTMFARAEGEDRSRVRILPGPERSNINGLLHGGFLMGFLDQSLFLGPAVAGRLAFRNAVTLSVASQFVSAGVIGTPLDSVVEIVQETGRLMFLTGRLEQEGRTVLTFQATLRKMSQPPSRPGA